MGSYIRPIANTVLVQDVSTSMTEALAKESGRVVSKIEVLKKANLALIQHKIQNCPKDLVGCVIFNDEAHILFKLTKPTNSWVKTRIQHMHVGGNTNMIDGLNTGMSLLMQRNRRFLRNIILLSDGYMNIGSQERLIAMAEVARNHWINIHTIGFGHSESTFDEALLKKVASTTHNGQYTHVSQLQQLVQTLIRYS